MIYRTPAPRIMDPVELSPGEWKRRALRKMSLISSFVIAIAIILEATPYSLYGLIIGCIDVVVIIYWRRRIYAEYDRRECPIFADMRRHDVYYSHSNRCPICFPGPAK